MITIIIIITTTSTTITKIIHIRQLNIIYIDSLYNDFHSPFSINNNISSIDSALISTLNKHEHLNCK